jgi:hypothetical protein
MATTTTTHTTTTATYTTGSSYNGDTKLAKMDGYGVYTFVTGTRYEGHFKDGMFHGNGKLIFPNGGIFESEWMNGEAVSKDTGIGGTYTFSDGLEYEETDWVYCHDKDRRFYTEKCHGLQPAGMTQERDGEVNREIPTGWYDTGDGYYNPDNHVIYTYGDRKFLRNADVEEHERIISSYRKGVEPHHQLGDNGLY